MSPETIQAVQKALDALWKEYGNGFGTPRERLMTELQEWIVEHTEER